MVKKGNFPLWFLFSYGALLVLIFVFALSNGYAWLTGWDYRKQITITENSGSALTDYQILIELNSSNFDFSKANSDGSDIRFTNSSDNLLNYWIENWDSSAEQAKIWVKVPNIPASGSTTIYMYYGNSSATDESDFNETFYDGNIEDGSFESDTVGNCPNGWYCLSTSETYVTDVDAYEGSKSVFVTDQDSGQSYFSKVHSENTWQGEWQHNYTEPIRVIAFFKHTNINGGNSFVFSFGTKEDWWYGPTVICDSSMKVQVYADDGSGNDVITDVTTFEANKWYRIIWYIYMNKTFKFCLKDTTTQNEVCSGIFNWRRSSLATAMITGLHAMHGGSTYFDTHYDNVGIMPLADPEPSVSVGAEESANVSLYFQYAPTYPYVNETVNFTAFTSGNFTDFWWNFGDNSTLYTTENTTSHVYTTNGTYEVNLTGYNADDGKNYTYAQNITVTYPLYVFGIGIDRAFLHTDENITFSVNVTGGMPPYTYSWDFNNTETGNGNPVNHSFDDPGYYNISVTVTDSFGHTNSTSIRVYVYPTVYIYAENTRDNTLIENFTVELWNETDNHQFYNSTGNVVTLKYINVSHGTVYILVWKQYYNSTVESFNITNSSDVNYTANVYPAVVILRPRDYDYTNTPVPVSITVENATMEYTTSSSFAQEVSTSVNAPASGTNTQEGSSEISMLWKYYATSNVGGTYPTSCASGWYLYLCDEDGANCQEIDSNYGSGARSITFTGYVYLSKTGTWKILNSTGGIHATGSFAYFPARLKIQVKAYNSGDACTASATGNIYGVTREFEIYLTPTVPTGEITVRVLQDTSNWFGYSNNAYASQKLAYEINKYSLVNATVFMVPDNEDVTETVYVLSSDNKPIEGAYVAAFKNIDGEYQMVSSSYTDGVGKALLTLKSGDTYIIVITASGYDAYTTELLATGSSSYFNLLPSVETWEDPFSGVALTLEPENVYAGENTTFRLVVNDPSGLIQSYWLEILKENETLVNLSGSNSVGGVLEYSHKVETDETGFYTAIYGFTRLYNGTEYTFNTSRMFPVIVHGAMEQAGELLRSNTFGTFGKAFISLVVITVAFAHGVTVGLLASVVLFMLGAITKGIALTIILVGVIMLLLGVGI